MINNGENDMKNKFNQIDKVYNYLADNNRGAGVTASRIAKFTHVPRANVIARIADLRNIEGVKIFSNPRTVNGKRKIYYRMAG